MNFNHTVNPLTLPPANEVWGKVIFSEASVILFTRGRAVCLQGVLPPGDLHLGESAYRRFCIQGGYAFQGDLHPGGSAYSRGWADPPDLPQGMHLGHLSVGGLPVGGLHPGVCLPGRSAYMVVCRRRGVCIGGGLNAPPPNQKSGQYASYWNVFFF